MTKRVFLLALCMALTAPVVTLANEDLLDEMLSSGEIDAEKSIGGT